MTLPKTRDMWAVEQLMPTLRNASVTILNPGFFADNYFRMGIGVATAVLVEPTRHAGRRYRVTGPALIGVNDIVDSLSRVLKRTVRPINAPEWLLNKVAAYRYRGELRYGLAVFHHYPVDHRQTAFALGGPTDAVLETTGWPAQSLDETVRTYAARPAGRRADRLNNAMPHPSTRIPSEAAHS